ncbi:hypothetical protein EDB92DRAFT_1942217 [Lactarius akahatsu]|uniref:Uncharacterized protein n=1 Tax=Lactarius akahatsu TaxID=416441 RepID=A0AAD4LLN6_9AGAM|nr:hypothetical protein EDB92DRAFT_1942217 [Lactarius akahatsu]
MVLHDALTLSPQARSHILNSLTLIGDDDLGDSPAVGLQINNLCFASPRPTLSPLPTFVSSCCSPLTSCGSPYVSCSPSLIALSSPAMSPVFPHASPPTSHAPSPRPCSSLVPLKLALPDELPVSRPLSPFVLPALALPNECPIITSTPLVNLLGDDEDDTFLNAHPLLSPVMPCSSCSVVVDDTALNEGVKTSATLVSTSRSDTLHTNAPLYPPLFLSCVCKQPRDPDEIEPTTPHHHDSTPCPDSPTPCLAIVPTNHPLHAHTRAKRAWEYDADDEGPDKRLLKQFAICTTPLPKFKKYRCWPKTQKYKPPKNQKMLPVYRDANRKPMTTDNAEPSVLQFHP